MLEELLHIIDASGGDKKNSTNCDFLAITIFYFFIIWTI